MQSIESVTCTTNNNQSNKYNSVNTSHFLLNLFSRFYTDKILSDRDWPTAPPNFRNNPTRRNVWASDPSVGFAIELYRVFQSVPNLVSVELTCIG